MSYAFPGSELFRRTSKLILKFREDQLLNQSTSILVFAMFVYENNNMDCISFAGKVLYLDFVERFSYHQTKFRCRTYLPTSRLTSRIGQDACMLSRLFGLDSSSPYCSFVSLFLLRFKDFLSARIVSQSFLRGRPLGCLPST